MEEVFIQLKSLFDERNAVDVRLDVNAYRNAVEPIEDKMIDLTGSSMYFDYFISYFKKKDVCEFSHFDKILDTDESTFAWSLLYFGTYLIKSGKGTIIHPEIWDPQTVEFVVDGIKFWLILSQTRIICRKK